MAQLFRLQHALREAAKNVESLPGADQAALKRKDVALNSLVAAERRLEDGNKGGRRVDNVGTRVLFESRLNKDEGVKLHHLFQSYPDLQKLGGLVKMRFHEVQMILEARDIVCPLALVMFAAAYQAEQQKIERAAETTKPSLLEA